MTPPDKNRTTRARRHVRAFIIWRAATAVDWDCTAAELAAELGIPARVITNICTKRGWRLRPAASRTNFYNRMGVDTLMKHPYTQRKENP